MICAKCGANVQDGVKFCGVCGQPMPAPVAPAYAPVAPAYAPAAPVAAPKKNNTMLIVIAAVAVVAVLLGCLLLFGGSGAEAAVENYIAVKFEGDFSGIEDLQPEAYWREEKMTAETLSDDAYSDIALPKLHGDSYAYLDSFDYEILLVDEYSEEELTTFNANETRMKKGIIADDVCKIYVEYTWENASGEEEVGDDSFIAYRYDGNWYVTVGDDLVNNIIDCVTSND